MSLLFAKSLNCFWLVWKCTILWISSTSLHRRPADLRATKEGRDWSLLARSRLQFLSFDYARGVGQVCYLGRRQSCHQAWVFLRPLRRKLWYFNITAEIHKPRLLWDALLKLWSFSTVPGAYRRQTLCDRWRILTSSTRQKVNSRNQLYPINSISCGKNTILVEAKVHMGEGRKIKIKLKINNPLIWKMSKLWAYAFQWRTSDVRDSVVISLPS